MSAGMYYTIDADGDLRGPFQSKAEAIKTAREDLKNLWTVSCGCLREKPNSWELPITILQAVGSYAPEYKVTVTMREVEP